MACTVQYCASVLYTIVRCTLYNVQYTVQYVLYDCMTGRKAVKQYGCVYVVYCCIRATDGIQYCTRQSRQRVKAMRASPVSLAARL